MMTKTNSSRFSSLVALLVLFAVLAVPVGAVSVADSEAPSEAEVGTKVTATVTLDQLYQDPSLEQWSLEGETDLTQVSWTVIYYDQTGAKVGQQSYTGDDFTSDLIRASDGVAQVELRIAGTVPAVDEFSYDPAQQFLVMDLVQTQQGGTSNDIETWEAHHYTESSREARQAIDAAASAIDSTGADTSEAEETLDSAVNAYEAENFDNAVTLANRAEREANQAAQSRQRTQYILYGVGALVLVGLVVGGFLWYRSQQDSYDKLG